MRALLLLLLVGYAHANECGDGVYSAGEECDDGDKTNGDGCSEACEIEVGWSCSASLVNTPTTDPLSGTTNAYVIETGSCESHGLQHLTQSACSTLPFQYQRSTNAAPTTSLCKLWAPAGCIMLKAPKYGLEGTSYANFYKIFKWVVDLTQAEFSDVFSSGKDAPDTQSAQSCGCNDNIEQSTADYGRVVYNTASGAVFNDTCSGDEWYYVIHYANNINEPNNLNKWIYYRDYAYEILEKDNGAKFMETAQCTDGGEPGKCATSMMPYCPSGADCGVWGSIPFTRQCTAEVPCICSVSPYGGISTCTSTCQNGELDATEACDDGNSDNGDGCSATCTVEAGWNCPLNIGGECLSCGDG